MSASGTWQRYRTALTGEPLPAALVDIDALNANIDAICAPVRAAHKRLRIASKSVRSVGILQHIAARAGALVSGLMTYAAAESAFLVEHGFTDVLLAYPTMQPSDAETLASLNKRTGVTASAMADCPEHLGVLEQAGARLGSTIPVVIDLDMSWRPVGEHVHVGVRRSPVRGADAVLTLARMIASQPHLRFHGVMGYEAQIAGVADRSPFSPWLNRGKQLMKSLSRGDVEKVRESVVRRLAAEGSTCTVFNGGGTGSLHWAAHESALTEVTAGSGFLASHLFDYYRDLSLRPAAAFALQVVRRPTHNVVTCHGGGYVASGEAGADRLPIPWLPEGLELLPLEGAGEVQTPVRTRRDVTLALGDPVFFRHAKAGELAEHFNEFLVVNGTRVERRVKTYRGMGKCFLG